MPVRVVRIIARLNIGGPAIQAITLTDQLASHGYVTTLVRGREEPDEGSMDYLAAELGVRPVLIPWMRRNPGLHDIPAIVELVRIIRHERPAIVHTHAAKAGTLGRVAALIGSLGRRPKPLLIHTYHGHSLSGYFSPRMTSMYRIIERFLGRWTDCLVAVSNEVRNELVSMDVAAYSKFVVVPLGFDLSPFTAPSREVRSRLRDASRVELGIPRDAQVVTIIARLVPIKRVDRFLRMARALDELHRVRFVVVGDGELREQLRGSADALALGDRLIWTGFRRDVPALCFASDVIVLTSDNEGTPVSLIEAQAAEVPVVSTDVGGAAAVVKHRETGFLVAPDDDAELARAVRALCVDENLAREMGRAGRIRATQNFELERLVSGTVRLYTDCMSIRR